MNRPPGGFFALDLVDSLNCVETAFARLTAVGLDVYRKKDLVHKVWPRAADSGGLAVGALRDITATSQSDFNRRQPSKHDYKSQAQPNIANPHAHFPNNRLKPNCVGEETY